MRSIERYLLAWMMGALCLGAVVIVLVTYLVTLDEMNEIFDADLKNVAEALGTHHRAGVGPGDPQVPRLPARTDVADPAEIVTITWAQDGRRVFSSDPRVVIPFMDREALTHVQVAQDDWIVYTDVSANGVAQAAQRASARRATAAEAASSVVLPLFGLVVFVAGLMVLALRRGLKPLDTTAQDVASRSASSLTPIATANVPREIAPLVSSINELMGRLSLALSTQRRFLADAAHELRTPATALRLQLQLLKRSQDEASRAEAIAELEAGIDRSQHLIEQLLHVARFEPDGETMRRERVDLGQLARSVVGAMSVKADHCGIDLGAAGGPGVAVQGDAGQLTVLLNNLVENALRFTPSGGVVDVDATLVEGRPALKVIDSGPGIAESERERVFARFYRGEDAPQGARDAGGSGLGLAIVAAIAQRHGAAVTLHSAASGRGLEVRVVFPPMPA
jgi:two-component system, OmpR family, sensor kinase